MSLTNQRPKLAITMGDPAGVGPETVIAACANPQVQVICQPVAVGHIEVFRRANTLLGNPLKVIEIESVDELPDDPTCLACLTATSPLAAEVLPAIIDNRGGQAAFEALRMATDLALTRDVAGVVTAPLNKAALWAAGHRVPGHTELLAQFCNVEETAMMLYLPPTSTSGKDGLAVVHVTLHTALRKVFDQITTPLILRRTKLLNDICLQLRAPERSLSTTAPRLAVCALNPHAGEGGLFGDEESQIIQPAVEQAKAAGIDLVGPCPTDSLMARAAAGEFDGVVAMYHDQGHIAVKLMDMHHAVNITLGLPILRTSVAHGTAFDLAWQGKAKSTGMVAAIETCARLANRKA